MFRKILIANRGEIALRIIRTCKEMGIKTVAVYSTADKNSLHVKFADEAVCIGPAHSSHSYLNISSIISAAILTNSDAIHPGYGFLSENETFAKVCEDMGIKFIGPKPEHIQKMGDKSTAKKTMKSIGIPTIPGSDDVVKDFEEAKTIASKIGYPIILKATAGGGGKGMRLVRTEEELETAWYNAQNEAYAAFKNADLYIEKYLENPRHIEIQVMADQYGNVSHLSERDCSIQRKHQKLIEETPSPLMTKNLRENMGDAALKAIKHIGYEGLGTIEFLVDKDMNFYFMEMNTRIQVEHPITEEVTGLDLVKEQILIAAGEKIKNQNYFPVGHAIECRINAEDPYVNFRPSPGVIKNLHLPGGLGIRVDTHVYAGYRIEPYYDSMIAKLIVKATNRHDALQKMLRALNEFIIEGIKTTIPFHIAILNNFEFQNGNYNTNFINTFEL